MTLDINISNSLVLNIFFHVLILFTFLYIFFFLYISKTEEKIINNQVNNLAINNIPDILKRIDDADTNKKIEWGTIKKKAEKIINDPPANQKSRENKNNNLKIIGGIIILSLIVITYIIFFHYSTGPSAPSISRIIIENLTTFGFIGVVEYIFFTQTASSFVPVYPDMIGTTILESVKTKIKDI